MSGVLAAPRERVVTANRLRQHLLEWGESGPLVLLLHGFLEHAHVWDWVAPHLAAAGYRVAALDWRGHGDSEWVGAGGYYHFADYAADVAFVLRQLGDRAAVVGHSMAGGAAVLYAGAEPARVWGLVSIEGLGPPDSDPSAAVDRYGAWIDDLQRTAQRPRLPLSLAEATARLRERYPRLPDAAVRHLASFGTRAVDGDRVVWKFDPLHQTRSPQPYYASQARAFWHRVSCPALYIDGAESEMRLPAADLAERLAALRARHVTLAGVGHHPHLERPDELVKVLLEFLDTAQSGGGGGEV